MAIPRLFQDDIPYCCHDGHILGGGARHRWTPLPKGLRRLFRVQHVLGKSLGQTPHSNFQVNYVHVRVVVRK